MKSYRDLQDIQYINMQRTHYQNVCNKTDLGLVLTAKRLKKTQVDWQPPSLCTKSQCELKSVLVAVILETND